MAALAHGMADLRTRLLNKQAGSMVVHEVWPEVRFDSDGEEYVQLTLIVSDPPDGQQMWPLDDAFELRQKVRAVIAEANLPVEVAITITSRGDADTSEEGDAGRQTEGEGEGL